MLIWILAMIEPSSSCAYMYTVLHATVNGTTCNGDRMTSSLYKMSVKELVGLQPGGKSSLECKLLGLTLIINLLCSNVL